MDDASGSQVDLGLTLDSRRARSLAVLASRAMYCSKASAWGWMGCGCGWVSVCACAWGEGGCASVETEYVSLECRRLLLSVGMKGSFGSGPFIWFWINFDDGLQSNNVSFLIMFHFKSETLFDCNPSSKII